MISRYIGAPGCRLDTGLDNGQTGPAIDLGWAGRTAHLWVRESGTGVGHSAQTKMTIDDLRALRDGATRLLVHFGVEEEITIAVPKR